MAIHQSSVNFENLIRDLAEMYPYDVSEVVLVELIANALDAKATAIKIAFDGASKTLVVSDNGSGMSANQFEEYHDFAAGLKTKGTGIGFAGVGAKISFNVADEVLTETRSNTFSGGSRWRLEGKKRLAWVDIPPANISGTGTRVEVRFRTDAKIEYQSREDITYLVRKHYLPLLDERFLALYSQLKAYPQTLRFSVNDRVIDPGSLAAEFSLTKSKTFFPERAGKRIGYGILGLAANQYPLGPDAVGVLICTHGKAIKADMFNQFPGPDGTRILGVVELPGLVNFLTTSKTDFIRGPGRHREFEKMYDPVRQVFKSWLTEIGVQTVEASAEDEAVRLERELKKLVDELPELSEFFGFRTKASIPQASPDGQDSASLHEGVDITFPVGSGTKGTNPGPLAPGDEPGETLISDSAGTYRADPITRTARRGPRIAFADGSGRTDLGWIDGNTRLHQ